MHLNEEDFFFWHENKVPVSPNTEVSSTVCHHLRLAALCLNGYILCLVLWVWNLTRSQKVDDMLDCMPQSNSGKPTDESILMVCKRLRLKPFGEQSVKVSWLNAASGGLLQKLYPWWSNLKSWSTELSRKSSPLELLYQIWYGKRELWLHLFALQEYQQHQNLWGLLLGNPPK